MSLPIAVASSARMYDSHSGSSPTSPALYVPVHRRNRSSGVPSLYSYAGSSSSRASSPSPSTSSSSSTSSTPPTERHRDAFLPIYSPADLLLLSASPLARLSPEHVDAIRAAVPEVVQSRKQRKALEWRVRHAPGWSASSSPSHKRTPSHVSHSSNTSESEEERGAWRRI
ncbi:hypothetical protein PAXRUDRAFT_828958 [Paxillus rubicundulus Ve08.2h10]|uniref:Uncharacterized protein n=1 Tax=Paxillus rubicundulus Ve08.2h10 TaxID=930991 RepID=A0A0D0E6T0_9AGAM|nr:hypothetical protein PAXRUDRAFT_828958 [Paxillus rubicundulus Ve08.2h10]